MRTWSAVSAIALSIACGGKSELGDGSGGGSGTGGASAGGGVGGTTGGTGGVGGSMGGTGGSTGGFGGSTGGFGGSMGGSAGSAAAGGTGGDVQVAIKEICEELSQLPCGMPLDQCWNEIQQGLSMLTQMGCGFEYEQLLFCANAFPIGCAPGGTDTVIHPSCDPLIDDVTQCIDGEQPPCAVSQGMGQCSISCTSWSANCKQQAGSLVCTCASGPSAGLSFSFPGSCNGAWTPMVEANCAP
jgi:hypothetical protein